MNAKRIIISAGHNPKAKGAAWEGVSEYDVTSKWVIKLKTLLEAKGHDVHIIKTGGLTKKVQEVNKLAVEVDRNAIALELHFNSAGTVYVEGNETLHYPGSESSKKLAHDFNEKFFAGAKDLLRRNRGVKEGWYRMDKSSGKIDYWLRSTKCKALISEPAFMCQVVKFTDEDTQKIQEALADALSEVANA